MDPTFAKTAHREFFLDAVGRLRVAFCAKGFVGHSPQVLFLIKPFKAVLGDLKQQECPINIFKTCEGRDLGYMKHRKPSGSQKKDMDITNHKLWWFRNYFKCAADYQKPNK